MLSVEDFSNLAAWFQSKYHKGLSMVVDGWSSDAQASSDSVQPSILVVLEDFEAFNSAVLSQLIHIITCVQARQECAPSRSLAALTVRGCPSSSCSPCSLRRLR
jgi:GTP:adenosylcobinamide-phosphate guanylyltransferase